LENTLPVTVRCPDAPPAVVVVFDPGGPAPAGAVSVDPLAAAALGGLVLAGAPALEPGEDLKLKMSHNPTTVSATAAAERRIDSSL
jgi:hypothetical protein